MNQFLFALDNRSWVNQARHGLDRVFVVVLRLKTTAIFNIARGRGVIAVAPGSVNDGGHPAIVPV